MDTTESGTQDEPVIDSSRIIVRFILMLGLLSACQSNPTPAGSKGTPPATPSEVLSPSPSANAIADEPPWGLDATTMPDSIDGVRSALEAIPVDLRGPVKYVKVLQRFDPVEVTVADAGGGSIVAFPWDDVRAFPGKAGSFDFVRAVSNGDMEGYVGLEREDRSLGRADPLVWATGHDSGHYLVVFGDPRSLWVFLIDGSSPEARAAIASTFADAVAS
jgi:hypothetical protein